MCTSMTTTFMASTKEISAPRPLSFAAPTAPSVSSVRFACSSILILSLCIYLQILFPYFSLSAVSCASFPFGYRRVRGGGADECTP